MTNDLLISSGQLDVRAFREEHNLEKLLRGPNCQVNIRRPQNVLKLYNLVEKNASFVVKTHSRPSILWSLIHLKGIFRASLSIRDPRDIVVSLLDHAKKIKTEGRDNSIVHLSSVAEAIEYTSKMLNANDVWFRTPGVLMVKYEDLLLDPVGQLHRLSDHIGLNPESELLEGIVQKYAPKAINDATMQKRTHFNKGAVGRYKSRLSPAEIDLCNKRFKKFIDQAGY